jgi:tetratricopeptide (TPR) repeat protein
LSTAPPPTLRSHLSALETAGLIQLASARPELEYHFRHGLFTDAAYASLVRRDRRAVHRAVAQTLEAVYLDLSAAPAARPGLLSELAHHFAEAHDPDRALHYFTLAGDDAARQYAIPEAIEHYTRAIGFLTQVTLDAAQPLGREAMAHLFTQRGRAQELIGQYAAALANYAELETLARQRADPHLELAAQIRRVIVHAVPSPVFDPERALRLADAAQELAQTLADREAQARLAWARMLAHAGADDAWRAAQAGEAALSLARALDHPELLATVLTDISRIYLATGRMEDGLQTLTEAEALWRQRRNLPMLAETITNRGAQHFFRGEYRQGLAVLQTGFDLSRSIGNAWGMAYNLMMRSYILLDQADYQVAIATMEQCLALAAEGGFIYPQTDIRAMLGLVYGLLGQPERAAAYAAEALAIAQQQLPLALATVYLVHSWLALLRGDLAAAEGHLRRAGVHFNPKDYLSANPYFLRMLRAELALERGEFEHALRHEAEVAELQSSLGFQVFRTSTLHLRGRALLALGRLAQAEAVLHEGLELARAQPSYRNLWRLSQDLAAVARARGDPTAAARWQAETHAHLLTHLGRLTRPDLREPFLQLPEVRAALLAPAPG